MRVSNAELGKKFHRSKKKPGCDPGFSSMEELLGNYLAFGCWRSDGVKSGWISGLLSPPVPGAGLFGSFWFMLAMFGSFHFTVGPTIGHGKGSIGLPILGVYGISWV